MIRVGDKYERDLYKHSVRRKIRYRTTGWIEYDEFYPRESKPIADEIDHILGRHYGFTEVELISSSTTISSTVWGTSQKPSRTNELSSCLGKPMFRVGHLLTIATADASYPERLRHRLHPHMPARVTCVGNSALLRLPMTALFCSARCPGSVILEAHDQAARWRDEGRCIISGFHSPVEKDCLQILLRGRQPIVLCPARAIDRMRVPPALREPLKNGRLLLISPFESTDHRVTKELAKQRNRFVAALADEIVFAHITTGGHLDDLRQSVKAWGASIRQFGDNESRVPGLR